MQGKLTLGFIHPFQLWGLNFTLNIFPSFSKAAPVTTNYGALWLPSALVCCLCTQPAQSHASEKKKIELWEEKKSERGVPLTERRVVAH